jgi:hypothetical protein
MSKRSSHALTRAAQALAHGATRGALALTAALALAHALSPQARAQKEAPASVSGRVRDGERPAVGISVVLVSNDPATRFRQVARAKTDADGRYLLSNVAPGRYQIMPFTPVHVVQGMTADVWPPGRPLTLLAGETVADVDFSVERGGVITGRVTDGDGNPVIAEFVNVEPADDKTPQTPRGPLEQRNRTTDDRGVYRVYGLAPGRYRVSVGTGGENGGISYGRRKLFERTFHPGVTDKEQARVVEVKSGDEAADVDITVGRAIKTYRASGRFVIAETGQPAPGVSFAYGGVSPAGDLAGGFGGGLTTNARGEFYTEALAPGRYAVFTMPSPRDTAEFYSDSLKFEVTNADVTGLVVPLKRGASVSGFVTLEGVADRATAARLLARVRVNGWVETGERTPSGSVRSPEVAPDGSFRLGGLRPGKLRLYYNNGETAKSLNLLRIELNGAPVGGDGISIAEGAQITGVRIRLIYGTGVIRGQTVFLNGMLPMGVRAIASAHVVGADVAAAVGEGMNTWRRVETDVRGLFRIEGLPAGEYEVVVNVMGGNREVVSEPQRVTVADGAEVGVSPTIDLNKLTPPPPRVVAPPNQ